MTASHEHTPEAAERGTLALLTTFARAYPVRTGVMLACLILASLFEGFGIAALLPLLDLLVDKTGEKTSTFLAAAGVVLGFVGLQPTLQVLLGAIAAGISLKAALILLAMRQVGYTVANIATDLRLKLFEATLGARWTYFVQQPAGALANAASTEVIRAAQAYRSACRMCAFGLQVVAYSALAILVSWKLTLGGLVLGVLVLLPLRKAVQIASLSGIQETRMLKSMLTRLADSIQGVKAIKAMGREVYVAPLLETEALGVNQAQRKQIFAREIVNNLPEPIIVTILVIVIFVALEIWQFSLATMTMVVVLMYRMANQINRVQQSHLAMSASASAYWSLTESIEHAKCNVERSFGKKIPRLTRSLELSEISYSYEGANAAALDKVSLVFPKGTWTTLTGPSGAGKTTIVDLVVGLLVPTSGNILVDGVPLSDVDIGAWRKSIGYVPQELLLFHGSVLQNVTMGDPTIHREAAERALRLAGVWSTIEQLPHGVDTVVGERGARFSGGQRQRIALARALARRPRLLILDEVTAALDHDTSVEICNTILGLLPDLTVLAVSHDSAMVGASQNAFRLEQGRVVARKERIFESFG